MLPTSLDFFAAFFGILLAGGVPVPIYPPARRSQLEDHFRRQSRILANALATVLITVPEARGVARLLRAAVAGAAADRLGAAAARGAAARRARRPGPARHRVPAVHLRQHRQAEGRDAHPRQPAREHPRDRARAAASRPADVFVSWLPLYHDMGLIGAWLGSLYFAVPLVGDVAAPTSSPGRRAGCGRSIAIAARCRRARTSPTRCARRASTTRELAGLDLSSWRVAFNGAEPVSPDTIARFNERFAAYGFDARAQFPVYGLAESAVGLAFPPVVSRGRSSTASTARPSRAPASRRRRRADDRDALRVVACGRPLPGHEIRIVDAAGASCPSGTRAGSSSAARRRPAATSATPRRPARCSTASGCDTGDLGYVAGGELHLTGRVKDLIIRGGQHIHPQEAEAAVGGMPGVRKGCVAVFGVPDRAAGTEKVVVLAETRETRSRARREALRAAIAALGLALLGAPPDDIVLAPPHTVLKTSSGKIRRAACSELYQRGMLRPGSAPAVAAARAPRPDRRGGDRAQVVPARRRIPVRRRMRGRCSCRWRWPRWSWWPCCRARPGGGMRRRCSRARS